MRELLKLILRVLLTLIVGIVVSYGILHYVPFLTNSLAIVYGILIVVSSPGISASFWFYSKSSSEDAQKPEIPLKSEEEIFEQLDKDGKKTTEAPVTPEVIPASKMLVPVKDPGEAIKTVMQNRVIEALSKCKVNVDIKAEMDLKGEFKDPKISVAFITEESKKPDAPVKPEQKKDDREKLGVIRV